MSENEKLVLIAAIALLFLAYRGKLSRLATGAGSAAGNPVSSTSTLAGGYARGPGNVGFKQTWGTFQ